MTFAKATRLVFHIPWATSLKDKRQVRRSLIEKTKHRFNVSVSEIGTQDIHQTLTIGIALAYADAAYGMEEMEKIISFMESASECELVYVETFDM